MTLRIMLFQIGKIILFMKGSPLLSVSPPLPHPLHSHRCLVFWIFTKAGPWSLGLSEPVGTASPMLLCKMSSDGNILSPYDYRKIDLKLILQYKKDITFKILFLLLYIVCPHVCVFTSMWHCMPEKVRGHLCEVISPFHLYLASGLELRPRGLHSKCLCLLSHLTDSRNGLFAFRKTEYCVDARATSLKKIKQETSRKVLLLHQDNLHFFSFLLLASKSSLPWFGVCCDIISGAFLKKGKKITTHLWALWGTIPVLEDAELLQPLVVRVCPFCHSLEWKPEDPWGLCPSCVPQRLHSAGQET